MTKCFILYTQNIWYGHVLLKKKTVRWIWGFNIKWQSNKNGGQIKRQSVFLLISCKSIKYSQSFAFSSHSLTHTQNKKQLHPSFYHLAQFPFILAMASHKFNENRIQQKLLIFLARLLFLCLYKAKCISSVQSKWTLFMHRIVSKIMWTKNLHVKYNPNTQMV